MVHNSQQCKYCIYVLISSQNKLAYFFSSPQCNGNGEKTKPEEGQAVTYLASMQNERTKD
jgi:hypothetical protein